MIGEKQVWSVPSSDIAVTSMSLVVRTSVWDRQPRLRVSLSPPTDTKVALALSPTSLDGESPVAMLGFFLGLGEILAHVFSPEKIFV